MYMTEFDQSLIFKDCSNFFFKSWLVFLQLIFLSINHFKGSLTEVILVYNIHLNGISQGEEGGQHKKLPGIYL